MTICIYLNLAVLLNKILYFCKPFNTVLDKTYNCMLMELAFFNVILIDIFI